MKITTEKERPILFKGAMVKALLADTKTQTRRIAKFFDNDEAMQFDPRFEDGKWKAASGGYECDCPYGKIGDILWCKETWQLWEHPDYCTGEADIITQSLRPFGKPDNERTAAEWRSQVAYAATVKNGEGPWRPSIFMPRWASRITLEIVSVRVQRLQEISESDAIEEGITWDQDHDYIGEYRKLWETINGPGSWAANPWVWVVEFKRLKIAPEKETLEMKITRAIIDSGKSDRGGWSAAQLAILGVSFPPQHGWPARIIGTEISARDYERFLELRNHRKKQKIGAPKRPPKEHAELFAPDIKHFEDIERRALFGPSPEDFANDTYEKSNRDLA